MKINTAFRHIAVISALCIASALAPAYAQPRGWEQVRTERGDARRVAAGQDVEVKVAGSQVVISSNHAVQIKIFTILGRVVTSETLSAGTHQFQLPSHGVYMVKAGDITCKIAV